MPRWSGWQRVHRIRPFIQYTSGSTGTPKGVVLSHANLLANVRSMGERVKAGPNDVFVSWLPLYHDMGLIGAWFGSLYYGALLVIMSPLAFLARPQRWLRAIDHYHGTLSAAPNFAYELCVHRLTESDIEGISLASWRAAFNGAEAVIPSTIRGFIEKFSPSRFLCGNNEARVWSRGKQRRPRAAAAGPRATGGPDPTRIVSDYRPGAADRRR